MSDAALRSLISQPSSNIVQRNMGFSRAHKRASHERILNLAAKQIKERGLDSIAIGELMEGAGLTKGAFYAHFASRDDLLLQATIRAKKDPERVIKSLIESKEVVTLEDVVDAYLSPLHIDNPGAGCAVCALAGEAKSAPESVRTELTSNYKDQVEFVARSLTGESVHARAVGILSTLVGAVSLARSLNDQELVGTLLSETKKLILDSQRDAHL